MLRLFPYLFIFRFTGDVGGDAVWLSLTMGTVDELTVAASGSQWPSAAVSGRQ